MKNVLSLVNHQIPQTLLPSPEDKRNDASSFATFESLLKWGIMGDG